MAVICVRTSHNFPLMFQNQAAGKLLNLFFLLINFLLHLTQLLASANQPQVQVGQSQSSSDLDSWGVPKEIRGPKALNLKIAFDFPCGYLPILLSSPAKDMRDSRASRTATNSGLFWYKTAWGASANKCSIGVTCYGPASAQWQWPPSLVVRGNETCKLSWVVSLVVWFAK